MENRQKKLTSKKEIKNILPTVGSIGFGSMASAFCRILKNNGISITIGARSKCSQSALNAKASDFKVVTTINCIKNSDYILLAIPDNNIPEFFKKHNKSLFAGKCVILCHGYSFLYTPEIFPENCDVILISPNAIANKFYENSISGDKNYALTSLLQNATGGAHKRLERFCRALNLEKNCLVKLTAKQEVVSDLFAEQTLLVGGILALITASFETMKKNGIPAQAAYLSTFHEIKYIVDTICENGIGKFINNISTTALYGSVAAIWESGFIDEIEKKFNDIYQNINSGNFYDELKEINRLSGRKNKIERHIKNILKSDICKIYERNEQKRHTK